MTGMMQGSLKADWIKAINNKNISLKREQEIDDPKQTNLTDCEVQASNLNLMNPCLTKKMPMKQHLKFPKTKSNIH